MIGNVHYRLQLVSVHRFGTGLISKLYCSVPGNRALWGGGGDNVPHDGTLERSG